MRLLRFLVFIALVLCVGTGSEAACVGGRRVVCLGGNPFILQGALMLEDGTSFLLLEDNSSHLCFQGGC